MSLLPNNIHNVLLNEGDIDRSEGKSSVAGDDESGIFFDYFAYVQMTENVESDKVGIVIMKGMTRWRHRNYGAAQSHQPNEMGSLDECSQSTGGGNRFYRVDL